MENYFKLLNDVNVSDKTEKKNGLTYLSWAWAWAEVKKLFPDATYKIYENKDEWNYFTDGKTCWVKTGVIVNGIEHIEFLPVMDLRNKSISADAVTSFDVNKAIQRSLTKACARHGLGLYVYAGEDLPESAEEATEKPVVRNIKQKDLDLDNQYLKSKNKELEQVEINCDYSDYKLTFGKHAGKTLQEIYVTNQDYLIWLKDNSTDSLVKEKVNKFLDNALPF